MGRDGYVNIDFDYMVTPDGREIPIQASLSTKDNLVKGAAGQAVENMNIAFSLNETEALEAKGGI